MSPGKGRLVSFISSSHTHVWQTDNGRDNLDAASRGQVVGQEGTTGWGCFTNRTSQYLSISGIRNGQTYDGKEKYVSVLCATYGW